VTDLLPKEVVLPKISHLAIAITPFLFQNRIKKIAVLEI
jgi:hypothetical protein